MVKKVRIEGLSILFPTVGATTNFHQCKMAWCNYVMRVLGEIGRFIDDDEWEFPTAPEPPKQEDDDNTDDLDFEEESRIQETLDQ